MTPRVLSNIIVGRFEVDKLTGDEDFEKIDGWEELSDELRVKVRQALIDGHVADEDWKGVSLFYPIFPCTPLGVLDIEFCSDNHSDSMFQDPECNRPGMNGFRIRTLKKDKAVCDMV